MRKLKGDRTHDQQGGFMTHRGKLVQPLFEGPVDLIRDVHGEIHALLFVRARLDRPP